MKYIGLMDCNNFFVSCERLFRPDLMDKPVAVLSSNDGCIVARSQEVKDMGVPMGLPLFQAQQLVDMSKVTLFSSNFTLYRDLSARVMRILADEIGDCEVYSIDEAFFEIENVTEFELSQLRSRIIQKIGIPVSIGLAATKTLAKVASHVGKKGSGVCILDPKKWQTLSVTTPCGDIWGLGRRTAAKLSQFEIRSAADFMATERSFVRKQLGVVGERIYDELNGVSVYGVGEGGDDDRQSTTSSRSFASTTSSLHELESAVAYHAAQVAAKIRAQKLAATMMYVELRAGRHSDFSHRKGGTEVTLDVPINDTQKITELALGAVRSFHDPAVPYKKAGVTLAGLIPEKYISDSLFVDPKAEQFAAVSHVLDGVQKRFGFNALHSAAILPSRDRGSVKMRSRSYTTVWKDIPTVQA